MIKYAEMSYHKNYGDIDNFVGYASSVTPFDVEVNNKTGYYKVVLF